MAGFYNAFGGSTGYTGKAPASVVGTTMTNEGFQLQQPFLEDLFGTAGETFFETSVDDAGVETKTLRIPEQYAGETIAGFTPEQETAFNMLTGIGAGGLAATGQAGSGQYMTKAREFADLVGQEFDSATAEKYMNPYLENVTRQAEDEALRRYRTEIEPKLGAEAAAAGAFGGSRAALLESEGQRNLLRQMGDIRERGLAAGFDQGRRAFEAQKAREQGLAGFYGQLAESAPRIGAMEAGLVSSVGEQRRGIEQARLDRAEKEFIEQRDAPMRQLAQYQSILQGFPYSPSTYEVKSTYQPQPSFGQQLIGGLGTAGSLYGAFGGFNPAGRRRYGGLVSRRSGGQVQGGLAGLERHADINYTRQYGSPRGSSSSRTGTPLGTGYNLSDQIIELIGGMGGPRKGDYKDFIREHIFGFRPDVRRAELGYRIPDYVDTLSMDEDILGFIEQLNAPSGDVRFGKELGISTPVFPPKPKPEKPSAQSRSSERSRNFQKRMDLVKKAEAAGMLTPYPRFEGEDEAAKKYLGQVAEAKARQRSTNLRNNMKLVKEAEAAGMLTPYPRFEGEDEAAKKYLGQVAEAKARQQRQVAEANARLDNPANYSDMKDAEGDLGLDLSTIRERAQQNAAERVQRGENNNVAQGNDGANWFDAATAGATKAWDKVGEAVAGAVDSFKESQLERRKDRIANDEVKAILEKGELEANAGDDPGSASAVESPPKAVTGTGTPAGASPKRNSGSGPGGYTDLGRAIGVVPLAPKGKGGSSVDPMDKYFKEYMDAISDQPTGEQELTEADKRLQKDMWLSLAAAFSRFGSTGHAGGIVPAFLKEVPQTIADVKKAQKAYREDQKYANKQNALLAKDKLTADLARQNIFLKRMGVEADLISANAALVKAGMMDRMDYQDFTRMLVQFTDTSNLAQLDVQKVLAEAMRRVQENPRDLSKVLTETLQWARDGGNDGEIELKTGSLPPASKNNGRETAMTLTDAAVEKLRK